MWAEWYRWIAELEIEPLHGLPRDLWRYRANLTLIADLTGADEQRIEHDDQVTGRACETLVAAELLKHASWARTTVRVHHYQREREDIDFVLESRTREIAAIEVKAKASLSSRDWKWLAALRDARPDRFKSGIVIYSGEQTIPLGDRLWAVPYSGLWA